MKRAQRRADKSWDHPEPIDTSDGELPIPSVGDLVQYLGGSSGQEMRVRKVIGRCMTYFGSRMLCKLRNRGGHG